MARLFALVVALSCSSCITAGVGSLFGVGVYGAVKEQATWQRIECGWMRKSPYPAYEVCARVRFGADVFGLEPSPVWLDFVPSNCPPPREAIACVVDRSGRFVADVQTGSATIVIPIHPDPFAPICATGVAHGPIHHFLTLAGRDPDLNHKQHKDRWKQVNGCRGG